jgi:hypothetical protein
MATVTNRRSNSRENRHGVRRLFARLDTAILDHTIQDQPFTLWIFCQL